MRPHTPLSVSFRDGDEPFRFPKPSEYRSLFSTSLGSNTGNPSKHGGRFLSAIVPDSPPSTESSPESSDSDRESPIQAAARSSASKPFVAPRKIKKVTTQDKGDQPKTRVRGVNWVFTLNNPPGTLEPYAEDFKFLAYQEEVGAKGTKHFQGLLVCKTQQSLSGLQRILPRGIHLEIMKGTFDQALAYCMKSDTAVKDSFVSWGEPPVSKGKKIKLSLEERIRLIKNQSLIQLYENDNSDMLQNPGGVKFIKGIQSQAIRASQPVKKIVDVTIYEGPPGCGKTHTAVFGTVANYGSIPFMLDYYDGQFWVDGYDPSNLGHKTILMDDFSCKPKIDIMLRFLDCYPVQFQCKGGFVSMSHDHMIITTNIPVSMWYDGDLRQEALQRRIGQYGTYLRWNEVNKTFEEDRTFKDRWASPVMARTSTLVVNDFLEAAAKLDLEED